MSAITYASGTGALVLITLDCPRCGAADAFPNVPFSMKGIKVDGWTAPTERPTPSCGCVFSKDVPMLPAEARAWRTDVEGIIYAAVERSAIMNETVLPYHPGVKR